MILFIFMLPVAVMSGRLGTAARRALLRFLTMDRLNFQCGIVFLFWCRLGLRITFVFDFAIDEIIQRFSFYHLARLRAAA